MTNFNLKRFRNCVIVIITVFFSSKVYAQDTTVFRYFVGITEPDPAWKDKNFDDGTWNRGHSSIGYGDKDDVIATDTTTAIYLRYQIPFSKAFLQNKLPVVFYFDFDDGFIGYINGVEFIRVNIADSVAHLNHLTTTSRSHEADNYRDHENYSDPNTSFRPLKGYYFDTAILSKLHLDTLNTLAFEVHNDSLKGSDMSFWFYAEEIGPDYDYNPWSRGFTAPVKIDSTALPIIVIETDEYGCNLRDVVAKLGVINNGKGKYNKPTDPFTDYNGRIRLKLHGQTSKDFAKKQFKLEIQDSTGMDVDTALLGMPKGSDWILYGPYIDKSLLRNEFVFKIGKKMGYYEPRTRFCELIYNGRNMGFYALTEQIKRDNKRVNVAKMDTTDISEPNVTGGYIFRYDKDFEGQIEILYPNSDRIHSKQTEYIRNYYNKSDQVLLSNYFSIPTAAIKTILI